MGLLLTMARIFTLDFEFRGTCYAALVATWQEGDGVNCFQVNLQDDDLVRLAPQPIIRFTAAVDDLPKEGDNIYLELLRCLQHEAVAHLQKISAYHKMV